MKKIFLSTAVAICLLAISTWFGWLDDSSTTGTKPTAQAVGAILDETERVSDERSVLVERRRVADAVEQEVSRDANRLTLTVHGTVVAPVGGNPCPGASVFLSRPGSMDVGNIVAQTDEFGRFVLDRVAPGSSVSAFVAGYSPCPLQPVDGDPGGRIEMRLVLSSVAVSVRGRILDPAGDPIENARVMVGRRAGPGGYSGAKRLTDPPPLWLRSDANGNFETQSAPRRAPVHVFHPEYAAWTGCLDDRAGDMADREFDLVVRLQNGGRLEGAVRDASGRPLSGAWIYLGDRSRGRGPNWDIVRVRAGVDGRFVFDRVPAGAQQARATHEGYLGITESLDFVDGGTNEWHPVLLAAPRIQGRVVDESGEPLARLRVQADGDSASSVTTDADGRFEIAARADSHHDLSVYYPNDSYGIPIAKVSDVFPGPGERTILVNRRMLDFGNITAVLQHPDGRGIGRVEYVLWRDPFDSGCHLRSDPGTGQIECSPVPPGRYRIDGRADGYALLQHEFVVEPGTTADLGDLRFERPGRLVVNVRCHDGSPMPRGGSVSWSTMGFMLG